MNELSTTAPAFVEMAHRIVWATAATVSSTGQPRSRIVHPIWEWDGSELVGWFGTFPGSPKTDDLAHESRLSLTYWSPEHDTCTADCDSRWVESSEGRHAVWDRFLNGPEPVGFDPTLIPGWTDPDAPGFAVLELRPTWLRVFPGTMLLSGTGDVLTWRQSQ
ncbi:pyridoxamine 5'-phosphate oxidase family protein [Ilumatobacter coccineus]|uniref:Pyridoxamine 5'-phosphate oxidase putative domain-containing protein n=1 Tax=Ilumatobacter coccineus (strain NBRC 103263 / KCTC 29153 / YM16-304) TaxID=1313172 RepID=A0A6C7E3M4_ILUCY|nr:pyridoxamine 5'-phosphate oxidase family protein [Ilumatobacter coccineus]BAN01253.1 hypothetical protein YM304_09390 [Ilumatobacter coccineus YM16-304]